MHQDLSEDGVHPTLLIMEDKPKEWRKDETERGQLSKFVGYKDSTKKLEKEEIS
jgi:hypothetical protein